jgi:hypothetical protein
MKRTICVSLLAAVSSACTASEPTRSEHKPAALFAPPPTLEDQAKDAEQGSKPRKEHYSLDPLVGTWTTRLVNVAADGTESDPHLGNAKIMWVMGDRFLNWDATLDIGPQVHETMGYFGYDLNQGEYQLLMISDLTTGMSVAHGRGDINAKGIRLTIEVVDPTSGAIKRAQSTLRLVDKNHFLLEQLGVDPQGEERIVRRTHYQRRGASASP